MPVDSSFECHIITHTNPNVINEGETHETAWYSGRLGSWLREQRERDFRLDGRMGRQQQLELQKLALDG